MPTIANSHIPAPKSWDEFEEICLSASKIRWKSTRFFRNGRPGQKQDGIDVWGYCCNDKHIGVQCKNTIDGVSLAVVETEIENASKFQPPLNELYIATTAPRDATLQRAVRKISVERTASSLFSVDILFWPDISSDLGRDSGVFFGHYPQFSPEKASPQANFFSDDLTRLRKFITYIGPLVDYLRQMGGEVAHRIDDDAFEALSSISNDWPITVLRCWDLDIAKLQDKTVDCLRAIYGLYSFADYHATGSGLIFTWKQDQRHNASLNDRKDFAEEKIREILHRMESLQDSARSSR
ncbi:hypothetical protein [Azonexus sp. IMCC34839]|uniref:hypothetical protein n=1 Tax=Azonexus sp. IMCC34839 TaxID=3133695 RepID=UPI00399ADA15